MARIAWRACRRPRRHAGPAKAAQVSDVATPQPRRGIRPPRPLRAFTGFTQFSLTYPKLTRGRPARPPRRSDFRLFPSAGGGPESKLRSSPMKLAASLLACALLIAGGVDASAAKRVKEKAKDVSAKPALVGAYGDWKQYHTASGKSKICYLLAEPKSREPDGPKAYAFISERPAEHVRNEKI